MFNTVERMIAFRYLKSKRRGEGFISVIAGFSFLGILLGVATLIIVMSVMNGFRHQLLGRILEFNSHLSISEPHGSFENYQDLVSKVRQIPGVLEAAPVVEGQAMIMGGNKAAGVIVKGMETLDLQARKIISQNLIQGSLHSFESDSDDMVLGTRLAEKLRVGVGGSIRLISPDGTPTPFGTIPRMKTFRVCAIFDAGMSEYNMGYVFIPLKTAQTFFKMDQGISTIDIFVDTPDRIHDKVPLIQEVVHGSFRYMNWQQSNATFFEAVIVERNVMFLILTLIIVIAAFNVISGLIMLVKDKTRDIGILRTMGMRRGAIMRIFFLTGSSIGMVGTAGGTFLGLLFALNIESIRQFIQQFTHIKLFNEEIYFLSKLPAIVEMREVTTIVIMSLCLSFLATLYPAWKAARLKPVEALRHD